MCKRGGPSRRQFVNTFKVLVTLPKPLGYASQNSLSYQNLDVNPFTFHFLCFVCSRILRVGFQSAYPFSKVLMALAYTMPRFRMGGFDLLQNRADSQAEIIASRLMVLVE